MNSINIKDYATLNHQVITKNQFYERYHFLSDQEEELDNKNEKLDPENVQELSVLVTLVTKEKKRFLLGQELVEVSSRENKYYHVQFQNENIEKLNNSIKKCLSIKNVDEMLKFFKEDQKYRRSILNQISTTYLDTIRALKKSHEINIDMIRIIKRIESLHMDVITADIYPMIKKIFLNISASYNKQMEFNKKYTEQVVDFISIYKNDQELQNNVLRKKGIIESIRQLGNNFTKSNIQLKNLISKASEKVKDEFANLSPDSSYKIFLEGLDSNIQRTCRYLISSKNDDVKASLEVGHHYNKVYDQINRAIKRGSNYDIENDCSNYAVWKIERADAVILEATRCALASLSYSVQSMESNWTIKMDAIHHRLTHLLAFSIQNNTCKNKEVNLSKFLDEILELQSICVQNEKHNEEIRKCQEKEQALFDQEVTKISGKTKVFIQNSFSNKYLICHGEEVLDEKNIKNLQLKHSMISLVDHHDSNRIIWDLIEGSSGGTMIRNTVSCQYLTYSPDDTHSKEGFVKGKHQVSSKLERISIAEKFEGQWKVIKIEDVLKKVIQQKVKATNRLTS
jgi:hypothetical protein